MGSVRKTPRILFLFFILMNIKNIKKYYIQKINLIYALFNYKFTLSYLVLV